MNKTLSRIMSVMTVLSLLLISSCSRPVDHAARYKPLVDAYIGVWNSGDVDALDAIIHPDFMRSSDIASTLKGVAELKLLIASFRAAYPDARLVSNDELYSGNRFAGRWTLMGGEETEESAARMLWGINIIRFEGDKIIEEWDAFDNLSYKAARGYQITPP